MIQQRQIIEVPFNLPQGTQNHPAIVLSSNDAIMNENGFIAMMITTEKKYDDQYTFEITKEMLTKPFNIDYCQARLHLISFFNENDVIKNSNWNNNIKKNFFEMIIEQVNKITFDL